MSINQEAIPASHCGSAIGFSLSKSVSTCPREYGNEIAGSAPTFTSFGSGATYWYQFGFNPIPLHPKTKHPVVGWDGWLEDLSLEKIERYWSQHPDHEVACIVGDGILVLDADSPESADALKALEDQFGVSSNLVVRTKRGEHHYYRRANRTIAKSESHSTENYPERLDVRTGRAMIILPPSTGKTFASEMDTPRAQKVAQLTEVGQDFIDAISMHNGGGPRSKAKGRRHIETTSSEHHLRLLREILFHIDPDSGYDEWVRVGMALYNETHGNKSGLALFDDWSKVGNKYDGANQISKKWESFRNDLEEGCTIGTLFWIAKEQSGVTANTIRTTVECFTKQEVAHESI